MDRIMKKTVLYLATILAAVSCGKEPVEPVVPGQDENPAVEESNNGEVRTVSVRAGIAASKAAVDDNSGAMTWQEGDAIGVWTGSEFTEFIVDNNTLNDDYPTFTASLSEGQEVGDLAVYPYNSLDSYNSGTSALTVNLPSEYAYSAANSRAFLVATNSDKEVTGGTPSGVKKYTFKHLGACMKITLSDMNKAIGYVTVSSTSKKLSGTYTVTLSGSGDEELTIASTETAAEQTIKINMPEEITEDNLSFYVPVPAGEITGFRVKAYTADDGELISKGPSTPPSLTRTTLKILPALSVKVLGGGRGTDSSYPMLISSKDDLVQLSAWTNNASYRNAFRGLYYKQSANITFDGEELFDPISQSAVYPFTGKYHGNGKTITNLKIDSSVENTGLFGYIESSCTIYKLNLVNPTVVGINCTGSLCGFSKGKISTCTVTGADIDGTEWVGGITGYTNKIVESCNFTGHVDASADRAGGIVGYGTVTVTGCNVNPGSEINASTQSAGGIVGRAKGCTITGCKILSTEVSPTTIQAPAHVGGILGQANNGVSTTITGNEVQAHTFVKSYNISTSSYGNYSGGILGSHYMGANSSKNADISTNVFSGNVSGAGNVGGIVGYIEGTSSLSISVNGNISGGSVDSHGGASGGVVGSVKAQGPMSLTVGSNYVNAGIESTGANTGGVLGYLDIGDSSYAVVTVIKNNKVTSDIQGLYSVGGILGYNKNYTGATTSSLTIINCAFYSGTLTSTGVNTNKYSLVGGIVGWLRGPYSHNIINCYSRPAALYANGRESGTKMGVGGIMGYENTYSDASLITCVYSTLSTSNTYCNNTLVSGSVTYYGGLSASITADFPCSYFYWDNSITNPGGNTTSLTNASNYSALSSTAMTDGTLLANLNAGRTTYNASAPDGLEASAWVAGTDGYPTISGLPTGE